MRARAGTHTRKLATARLEFSSDRRLRTALHAVAALSVVAAAGAVIAWFALSGRAPLLRMSELRRENATLKAETARLRAELEIERSTRAALTDQVAQLSQESGELRSKVEFFNAQSARSGQAR